MSKRPHIIIFNPDEMRWNTMAHMDNPAAITPNLDAFAAQDAVSFRNAYCQNPVCVPSRCSFFTGLYPHVHGHRTMTHLLRPGETSLLQELKQAGYRVWMNDRNDLTAGQYDGWTESHADEIWYSGESRSPAGIRSADYPGPAQRANFGDPLFYAHFGGKLEPGADGRNYNSDDGCVDAAVARAAQWREGDAPLCMFLGLNAPHVPYQVEEPYYSAIDRTKLFPRVRYEDCTGKSRMLELYHGYQGLNRLSETQWDEIRAVYLGMCMKVDALFGRLCDGLKQAGIYDDCAIFVLSDHGDFCGSYDMAEKAQNMMEDCLTRVPFLVKPPKGVPVDPGISDSLVELVDFYATAMELAQVQPAHTHFGRSLLPVLADRSQRIRDYAFCEGGRMPGETHCDEYHQPGGGVAQPDFVYWPKMVAQSDDEAHAKAIMVRSPRYKYISRSLGSDELYDLETDPDETTNRIDDPALASVVQEHRYALMKWLQGSSDIVPLDYDSRSTVESGWHRLRQMIPAERQEEIHQRLLNGENMYVIMAELNRL